MGFVLNCTRTNSRTYDTYFTVRDFFLNITDEFVIFLLLVREGCAVKHRAEVELAGAGEGYTVHDFVSIIIVQLNRRRSVCHSRIVGSK